MVSKKITKNHQPRSGDMPSGCQSEITEEEKQILQQYYNEQQQQEEQPPPQQQEINKKDKFQMHNVNH